MNSLHYCLHCESAIPDHLVNSPWGSPSSTSSSRLRDSWRKERRAARKADAEHAGYCSTGCQALDQRLSTGNGLQENGDEGSQEARHHRASDPLPYLTPARSSATALIGHLLRRTSEAAVQIRPSLPEHSDPLEPASAASLHSVPLTRPKTQVQRGFSIGQRDTRTEDSTSMTDSASNVSSGQASSSLFEESIDSSGMEYTTPEESDPITDQDALPFSSRAAMYSNGSSPLMSQNLSGPSCCDSFGNELKIGGSSNGKSEAVQSFLRAPAPRSVVTLDHRSQPQNEYRGSYHTQSLTDFVVPRNGTPSPAPSWDERLPDKELEKALGKDGSSILRSTIVPQRPAQSPSPLKLPLKSREEIRDQIRPPIGLLVEHGGTAVAHEKQDIDELDLDEYVHNFRLSSPSFASRFRSAGFQHCPHQAKPSTRILSHSDTIMDAATCSERGRSSVRRDRSNSMRI